MNKWVYANGETIGASWNGDLFALEDRVDVSWVRIGKSASEEGYLSALRLGVLDHTEVYMNIGNKTLRIPFQDDVTKARLFLKTHDNRDFKTVAEGLHRIPNIVSLKARLCEITEIHPVNSLTELDLGHNKLDNSVVSSIAQCKQIRKLCLKANNLNHLGAQALSFVTTLTDLDMSYNYIKDLGVSALLKLPSLTNLHAVGIKCTGEGLQPLKTNTTLLSLKLCANSLGSGNAGRAIASSPSLTKLQATCSHLSVTDLVALSYSTSLTKLHFGQSNGDDIGVIALTTQGRIRQFNMDVEGVVVSDQMYDVLGKCTSLTDLSIDVEETRHVEALLRSTTITDLYLTRLDLESAHILAANTVLTNLYVNEMCQDVLPLLSNNTTLTSMYWHSLAVDLDGAQSLMSNTTLTDLRCYKVNAGVDAVEILTGYPSLMHFDYFEDKSNRHGEYKLLKRAVENIKRKVNLCNRFIVYVAIIAKLKERMRKRLFSQ